MQIHVAVSANSVRLVVANCENEQHVIAKLVRFNVVCKKKKWFLSYKSELCNLCVMGKFSLTFVEFDTAIVLQFLNIKFKFSCQRVCQKSQIENKHLIKCAHLNVKSKKKKNILNLFCTFIKIPNSS